MAEEEFNLETENINLRRLLEQAGVDAAQHEVTERLQRLLMEELHHRIKNTLATVQAIATQSLQSAETMDQARDAINEYLRSKGPDGPQGVTSAVERDGRILGLGVVHRTLLAEESPNSVAVQEVS